MQRVGGVLTLTASDVVNHLSCKHLIEFLYSKKPPEPGALAGEVPRASYRLTTPSRRALPHGRGGAAGEHAVLGRGVRTSWLSLSYIPIPGKPEP